MSGLMRGKIECVVNTPSLLSSCQVVFKTLYDFFSAHPNYTVVALNYGLSGTNVAGSTSSGTGTGYYDQANSFGYNAWFVVRANATAIRPFDVYCHFQWAGGTGIAGATAGLGQSPGAPALVQGTAFFFGDGNHAGVCWSAAIGIGGTDGSTFSPNNGNPWKGSQNVNGADTKASVGPIWGAPAGGGTGVMIFPRSNNGGRNGTTGAVVTGAFMARAQNMAQIYTSSSNTKQSRLNIVADDDSWACFIDDADNGAYYVEGMMMYTPRPNVAQVSQYPIFMFGNSANIPFTMTAENTYGDVAGISTAQGGIVSCLTGSVTGLSLDHYGFNFVVDSNFWPDHQMPGTFFNEWPFMVGVFENNPTQSSGYLGQCNFMKEMFNVPTNATRTDFSRIFIGSATTGQQKISLPWDAQNSTVPRSGANRVGVTFVTSLGVE